MSETPGGPEHYTPPQQAAPPPPPPLPPSISDAAAQYGADPSTNQFNPYTAAAGQRIQPQAPPVGYYGSPKPSQGLAITSLVLGIIAFVTGWIPAWGVVIGVLAVILGIIALTKGQSKGMAIAGLITGVLGALTSAAMLVLMIIGLNAAGDPDEWFSYTSDDPYVPFAGGTTLGAVPVDGGVYVSQQAFGPSSWDDSAWWYAAVLENPGDTAFGSTELTIQALDATGAVIADDWTYVNLPNGQTGVTGTFYDVGDGEIASLAIVGSAPDQMTPTSVTGGFTASGLSAETDEYTTTVTGEVTSSYEDEVYGGTVVVLARDPQGNVIAVAPAYFEGLAPGASAQFEGYFEEPLPEGTQYEAFVNTY